MRIVIRSAANYNAAVTATVTGMCVCVCVCVRQTERKRKHHTLAAETLDWTSRNDALIISDSNEGSWLPWEGRALTESKLLAMSHEPCTRWPCSIIGQNVPLW